MLLLVAALWLQLTPLCDVTVADDAGVLKPDDIARIYNNSVPLVNQGADVRVRTVLATENLDVTEQKYERSCPSWQGANGGRKNTLVVLMVSPASRKLGIYYGSAWKSALDSHWNRIKTDYMVPHFRDRDWTGGFVATEQQLTSRFVAAKDEAMHPAVTQVTHQAASFTGLWIVFGFLAFIGACWALIAFLRRKTKDADEVLAAQQDAVIKRNAATDRINRYKEEVTAATQAAYDLAVENFARLMTREATNPDTGGLAAEQYENIGDQYWQVCRDLDAAIRPVGTPYEELKARHTAKKARHATAGATTISPGASAPSHSDTSIFAPVIINEETHEHYHERVDESPAPEPSTYEAPSHSSDDGGGSSSWSSDSSSSDSGGSSSFDSGGGFGGDSGGGGSSDF